MNREPLPDLWLYAYTLAAGAVTFALAWPIGRLACLLYAYLSGDPL